MKKNTDAGPIYIRWQYESVPVVIKDTEEALLDADGRAILRTQTTCYATLNKEIVGRAIVTRHYRESFDKDKARKYSLAVVLKTLFPGYDNKEIRRSFWETYFSRKTGPQPKKNERNESNVAPVLPMAPRATVA